MDECHELGRLFARTLVASDPVKISLVQENRVDLFNASVQFVDNPSNCADVVTHIMRMNKSVVRSTAWPRTTHRGRTLTRLLTSRHAGSRKHHSCVQRSSHRNACNTYGSALDDFQQIWHAHTSTRRTQNDCQNILTGRAGFDASTDAGTDDKKVKTH